MKITLNLLFLIIQITLTFIVTVSVYMIFAVIDNDFGLDGIFGLLFIQPVLALIISILTIIFCLILGLPIRLNNKIRNWWTHHCYIPIIIFFCGILLLCLALIPTFRETTILIIDEMEKLKQIPNLTLSSIGWLLTTFSILHLYPPKHILLKIKAI